MTEQNGYTMRIENPKPCPFCGSKSVTVWHKQKTFIGKNDFGATKLKMQCYCKCNKCHSKSKPISYIGFFDLKTYDCEHEYAYDYKFKLKAIEEWNKRAER